MRGVSLLKMALAVALLGVAGAWPVRAGDAEAGRALVKSWRCVDCHGLSGNDRSATGQANPMLAGQPEAFLVMRLKQYKSGLYDEVLKYPTMIELAKALTDRQIEDLAAWYSSQKRY